MVHREPAQLYTLRYAQHSLVFNVNVFWHLREATPIGIELALYFVTVRLILDGRKKKGPKAESRLLYLSTFFLIMTTVYVAIQGIFGEEMWIVNEGYPGGSAQYFATHAAVWYETFGTTCGILMNLGSDWFQVCICPSHAILCSQVPSLSIQIYRMYIVWEQDYRAIIIPSIVYLASAGRFPLLPAAYSHPLCSCAIPNPLPPSRFLISSSRRPDSHLLGSAERKLFRWVHVKDRARVHREHDRG